MSNRATDCATELGVRLFKKNDDDIKAIETLERENFELRNEVTRLTVHNATLRGMLANRNPKPQWRRAYRVRTPPRRKRESLNAPGACRPACVCATLVQLSAVGTLIRPFPRENKTSRRPSLSNG
jgi:hypothetical protein